jgi:hypothetical protein
MKRIFSAFLCNFLFFLGVNLHTTQAATSLSPIYISPTPDSKYASAAETIAIRFEKPLTQSDVASAKFNVIGNKSGRVTGRIVFATDSRTLIFKPSRRFVPGETVSAEFSGTPFETQRFAFGVSSREWPYLTKPLTTPGPIPGQNPNAAPPAPLPPSFIYVTAPSTLPVITFTNHSKFNTGNEIFFSTFFTPNPYLMIMDEGGELVYYNRIAGSKQILDFHALPDGRLIYFEGIGTNWGGNGVYRILDSSYRLNKTITAGHGYEVDGHDILMLPNGNTIVMVYDEIPTDLSDTTNLTKTLLLDLVVQEIDKNGNVLLNWRATDHIAFDESYEKGNEKLFDYVHGNSMAFHEDGDLLISLRHTSSVIKFNRDTGKIAWRLGGKKSDFKADTGAHFSYQHDARWLGNGRLTVFDNGNKYDTPTSRGLELHVDESNRTVSMAWEFRNKPDIYGAFLGNTQRLANGNSMIGWGGPRSIATEVNAKGEKQLEIEVAPPGNFVYRWYTFDWKGSPTTSPTLALKEDKLYFSWNGATEVAAYRVEAINGNGVAVTQANVARNGFESVANVEGDLLKACRYRVVALDSAGKDLRRSNIVRRSGNGC